MSAKSDRPSRDEQGSALVIAMLVTVILALLGIAYLLMAQTENLISQNEKRAAQTLYVAEAGLRAVKRWFDYNDGAMHFPDPSVVDRTQRRILDESDPYDPADVSDADGVLGSLPYYKQAVDLDGDGNDDLFAKPYRGDLTHILLGTEDGPDMRIDEVDPTAATFLGDLSETLLGDFPGEPGGVRARIGRIDVYAPPYVRVGPNWVRYGMGTIKVTVRIYGEPAGSGPLAEREARAVLSEAPYYGPHAPLHSCADVSFVPRDGTGPTMTVRWGAISAIGDAKLTTDAAPDDFTEIPMSLPRDLPFEPGGDQLWPNDTTEFDTWRDTVVLSNDIDDPWFRVISGGSLGPDSGTQPYRQTASPLDQHQDHSNLIQELPLVVCPIYDYDVWKGIALSGEPEVHYYAYSSSPDWFRENGTGTPTRFQDITNGNQGLFFFDTADALAPTDADSNGVFDNLTPSITLSGAWNFTGVIYLNAASLKLDGVTGPLRTIAPPGEPFRDGDLDGEHDAGERYINLTYPTTAAEVDDPVAADTQASSPSRDARGPAIPDVPVSYHGILYNTGFFEATGNGTLYGSLVAVQGVTQSPDDGTADTPIIIWDESILTDWPPQGWNLPRVVITEWDLEG